MVLNIGLLMEPHEKAVALATARAFFQNLPGNVIEIFAEI